MREQQAKRHLRRMLRSFTAGSVLHLLADLHGELAEKARREGDARSRRQFKSVEHTLFVVGLGIDAARPQ